MTQTWSRGFAPSLLAVPAAAYDSAVKPGRNDLCLCGSKLKYKNCCDPTRPKNPPRIKDLQDLRRYIETLTSSLGIFRLQRTPALLNSFRVLQTLHSVNSARSFASDHMDSEYRSTRDCQDLLRWLTFKLFERCTPGGEIGFTTNADFGSALAAIGHFKQIGTVLDLIVATESGFYRFVPAELHGPTEFALPDDLPIERIVRHVIRQDLDIQQSLSPALPPSEERPEFLDVIRKLSANATVTTDMELVYTVDDASLAVFTRLMSEMPHPVGLPWTWSVGAYSIGQFHRFWNVLQARVTIHEGLFVKAAQQFEVGWGPHNSGVLLLSLDQIRDAMKTHAALDASVTDEIVRDLRYDPSVHKWTDVMYQPLVPIDDSTFAVLPVVVNRSRFERNLLAILDRLPWRAADSHRIKVGREQLMIDEIEPVARALKLRQRPRVNVSFPDGRKGEIDLVLWPESADAVLCVSLKWFYGADSVREVAEHDKRYQEGIDTLRRSVELIAMDPLRFAKDRAYVPPFKSDAAVLGTIVGKHDSPSGLVWDEDLPAVTLEEFLRAARASNGDIALLHQGLKLLKNQIPEDVSPLLVPRRISLGDLEITYPDVLIG